MSPRYLADTNIYVTSANDAAFRQRFETFLSAQGPIAVSTVVAAEVLIGVANPRDHPAALRALGAGADVLAPQADDWLTAGMAIARLGGGAVTKSRSFWNDALLAAQCARLDAVLVTRNAADFRRLSRFIGVQTIAPFP